MANVLDLMTPEDRKKALARFKNSQKQRNGEMRISQEIYALSEFGYYYGWEAVMAVRTNQITLEEMYVLLEGARKVWYSKLAESARAQFVATGSAMAHKGADKAFRNGIKPFKKAAEVE